MNCKHCGSDNSQGASSCWKCGAAIGQDMYAPPASLELDTFSENVVDVDEEPWEHKQWRVSGLSWGAVHLAWLFPPVGFVLSLFAIKAANLKRRRVGNRAVAFAAMGTSIYMLLMVVYIVFVAAVSPSSPSYDYSDLSLPDDTYGQPADLAEQPWGSPEDMAELNRLLEQIQDEANAIPAEPLP